MQQQTGAPGFSFVVQHNLQPEEGRTRDNPFTLLAPRNVPGASSNVEGLASLLVEEYSQSRPRSVSNRYTQNAPSPDEEAHEPSEGGRFGDSDYLQASPRDPRTFSHYTYRVSGSLPGFPQNVGPQQQLIFRMHPQRVIENQNQRATQNHANQQESQGSRNAASQTLSGSPSVIQHASESESATTRATSVRSSSSSPARTGWRTQVSEQRITSQAPQQPPTALTATHAAVSGFVRAIIANAAQQSEQVHVQFTSGRQRSSTQDVRSIGPIATSNNVPAIPGANHVPIHILTTGSSANSASRNESSTQNMATFSGPDGSTGYLHATSTRSLQQQSHASTQHLGSSTFNGTSIAPQNVSYTPRTSVRPQFRSKVVCELACRHCQVIVCKRGMKAILLADTNVELYSTDSPPSGVALVNDDYITRNCHCRIRDVACLGCGNVVGYHVTQPCETCLEACNNGHFWMFHVEQVSSSDRLDSSGTRSLLWAHLPRADRDFDMRDRYELMCR